MHHSIALASTRAPEPLLLDVWKNKQQFVTVRVHYLKKLAPEKAGAAPLGVRPWVAFADSMLDSALEADPTGQRLLAKHARGLQDILDAALVRVGAELERPEAEADDPLLRDAVARARHDAAAMAELRGRVLVEEGKRLRAHLLARVRNAADRPPEEYGRDRPSWLGGWLEKTEPRPEPTAGDLSGGKQLTLVDRLRDYERDSLAVLVQKNEQADVMWHKKHSAAADGGRGAAAKKMDEPQHAPGLGAPEAVALLASLPDGELQRLEGLAGRRLVLGVYRALRAQALATDATWMLEARKREAERLAALLGPLQVSPEEAVVLKKKHEDDEIGFLTRFFSGRLGWAPTASQAARAPAAGESKAGARPEEQIAAWLANVLPLFREAEQLQEQIQAKHARVAVVTLPAFQDESGRVRPLDVPHAAAAASLFSHPNISAGVELQEADAPRHLPAHLRTHAGGADPRAGSSGATRLPPGGLYTCQARGGGREAYARGPEEVVALLAALPPERLRLLLDSHGRAAAATGESRGEAQRRFWVALAGALKEQAFALNVVYDLARRDLDAPEHARPPDAAPPALAPYWDVQSQQWIDPTFPPVPTPAVPLYLPWSEEAEAALRAAQVTGNIRGLFLSLFASCTMRDHSSPKLSRQTGAKP